MRESSIYLLLYSCAWLISFIFYYKKVKSIGVGGYVILLNFILSIISLLLFNDEDYFKFLPLKIIPFVYLFIVSRIVLSPLYSYDVKSKSSLVKTNSNFVFVFSIIYIAAAIISVPNTISNFSTGISKMLIDDMAGADLYMESLDAVEQTGSGISNLGSILSGAFSGVAYVLLFYNLAQRDRKRVMIFLLLLCLIAGAIASITVGQRGGLVEELNKFVVTYLLFRPFLSEQINKITKRLVIIAAVLALIPISLVTISRFGQSDGKISSSVSYYAGQSALYFNNYGLDDNGIRYGDRTFPLYKRMIGFSDVPKNFYERRSKYPRLKINDEVFSTYVGDWTIDFGPIAAFILLIMISAIFYKSTYIRGDKVYLHQLILLHLLVVVCTQGAFKLYPFSDVGGNLRLMVYLMTYFIFKFSNDKNTLLKKRYRLRLREADMKQDVVLPPHE